MKKWVSIHAGTPYYTSNEKELGRTEKDTFGFIQEEPNVAYALVRCIFGQVYFNVTDLEPALLPGFVEATDTIEEFESRHRHYTGFEFNIKFYSYDIPNRVKDNFSSDRINSVYYDILEYELRCLVDKKWCDGCLPDDFDWISDWHTAGRSGGWLVLRHSEDVDSDYFLGEYSDIAEELRAVRRDIENISQEEIDEGLLEEAQKELAYWEKKGEEIVNEAVDLAMDLELIDKIIEWHKLQLKEYIATEEPWQCLLEILEEEVPSEVLCPLCGQEMHYTRNDMSHTWGCYCGAYLQKNGGIY